MTRSRYILRRSLQTIVFLWGILTFLFFFFRFMPGNYSDLLIAQGMSPDAVEQMRARWGLEDPLYIQYLKYMRNFLLLDFGVSLQFGVPVWDYVWKKIFNSLILVGPAITTTYILGGILGGKLGTGGDSKFDRYGLTIIVICGTVPVFVLAIFFIIIFALNLDLFPASGMTTADIATSETSWWEQYLTWDFLYHYILPFSVIIVRYTYLPLLLMRTNVKEILDQDFFHYYRITGLPSRVKFRRTIKHASLPLLTLYPVSMSRAIGGLVLLEVVFNWPGMGQALVTAVLSRDFPVAQFVFFLIAFFVITGNFIVDILYGIIDPRVSVED
jgi:peptide/nickel transport system permease protein